MGILALKYPKETGFLFNGFMSSNNTAVSLEDSLKGPKVSGIHSIPPYPFIKGSHQYIA